MMELLFPETVKIEGEGNQEFHFGHVKCEVPVYQ
jgi:hypothetical protein